MFLVFLVPDDTVGPHTVTLDLCLLQAALRSSGNAQNEQEEDHSQQAELIHLARVVVVVGVGVRNGK
jgi:hypothetical protein